MVSRAKKPASVSTCSDPLQQAGVLELVFSFLGREGVFVQTVSKDWQALYNRITLERASSSGSVQSSSYTSFQAVFASAARPKLAVVCGLQLDGRPQRHAGRHADIDTLRVAFRSGIPRSGDSEGTAGAAESADLNKLIWLRTKQHGLLPHGIAAIAAAAKSVQMLQWLKKRGYFFHEDSSLAAAARPHNIPVLQYLQESGCGWHKDCCGKAGAAGDVAQLQWLCEHGAPLDASSAFTAAVRGSLPVFEFLQQQGVAFNSETMRRAAYNGQLQLCKWLRAAGCDWDQHACSAAAFQYHIGTLRWLLESGCPLNAAPICHQSVSGSGSCIEVLQCVLDAGGLAGAALLRSLLLRAGTCRKLAVAKWLRQHGAQWPSANQMCNRWTGEVLDWAIAEGCLTFAEQPLQ
jgi:hypothetical protein